MHRVWAGEARSRRGEPPGLCVQTRTAPRLALATSPSSATRVRVSVLEGSACASTPSFPYQSEHTKCANTPAEPELFAPTAWREAARPATSLRAVLC